MTNWSAQAWKLLQWWVGLGLRVHWTGAGFAFPIFLALLPHIKHRGDATALFFALGAFAVGLAISWGFWRTVDWIAQQKQK